MPELTNFLSSVGPSMIGPFQGFLLDNKSWSRPLRCRYAVVTLVILSLLICKFINMVNMFYIFPRPKPEPAAVLQV